MVTIKDIAKRREWRREQFPMCSTAKGNVSSEKIRRVMDAAHELGYVPNERAALLRKGLNDSLAVIMPDSTGQAVRRIFISALKTMPRPTAFTVTRHLANENTPASEEEALTEVRPLQVKGIACISSVAGTRCEENIYKEGSISRRREICQVCCSWNVSRGLRRILSDLTMRQPGRGWPGRRSGADTPMSVFSPAISAIPMKRIFTGGSWRPWREPTAR